jgi:hypothetical protein
MMMLTYSMMVVVGAVCVDLVSEMVQWEGGQKGREKNWTARSMLLLARQSSELINEMFR